MLQAKTIIKNKYWILKDQQYKIGEIEATANGYDLSVNGYKEKFKTLNMIKERLETNLEFVDLEKKVKKVTQQVYGYPTDCKPFNGLFNVQLGIPVFTKGESSKSWFAAGWYQIKQKKRWKNIQCPKLIILDRYEWRGPFRDKEEIISSIKDRV